MRERPRNRNSRFGEAEVSRGEMSSVQGKVDMGSKALASRLWEQLETRVFLARRATVKMHRELLRDQPSFYEPLDREVNRLREFSKAEPEYYDFEEIQRHLQKQREKGSRDDGGGADDEEEDEEPDSIYDVSETHSMLLQSVSLPEQWAGMSSVDLKQYHSFDDWKVEGTVLRSLLLKAYPNIERAVEVEIGDEKRAKALLSAVIERKLGNSKKSSRMLNTVPLYEGQTPGFEVTYSERDDEKKAAVVRPLLGINLGVEAVGERSKPSTTKRGKFLQHIEDLGEATEKSTLQRAMNVFLKHRQVARRKKQYRKKILFVDSGATYCFVSEAEVLLSDADSWKAYVKKQHVTAADGNQLEILGECKINGVLVKVVRGLEDNLMSISHILAGRRRWAVEIDGQEVSFVRHKTARKETILHRITFAEITKSSRLYATTFKVLGDAVREMDDWEENQWASSGKCMYFNVKVRNVHRTIHSSLLHRRGIYEQVRRGKLTGLPKEFLQRQAAVSYTHLTLPTISSV